MSETTLLDIQSDYIFKLVFGDEKRKHALISLLNSIFDGEFVVRDLTYQNPEMPKLLKDGKSARFDIRADIGEERYLDIEVQSSDAPDIPDRAVQYIGEMLKANSKIPSALKKTLGEEAKIDYRYPRVIGIWFFSDVITDRKNFLNEALFVFNKNEIDDYKIMTKKARIFFIELPKYEPRNKQVKEIFDAWLRFLKNPNDVETHRIPEIEEAFEALQEVSEDPIVRENYRAIMDGKRDQICAMNARVRIAVADAVAQEQEKAKQAVAQEQEKAKKEKIESARKMLNKGLDVTDIADFTGLTLEEIQKLIQ